MFTSQTQKSILKAVLTRNSPFYIQFYVSKLCHLKCRLCNIVEATADLPAFEYDKIEMIADNLVKIGAGVVLLTGGEPFLRHDIDEIVRIFIEKKLNVRLKTTGLMKRKKAISKCVEYGARDINISIDSLDENLSDYINGVKADLSPFGTVTAIPTTTPSNTYPVLIGAAYSDAGADDPVRAGLLRCRGRLVGDRDISVLVEVRRRGPEPGRPRSRGVLCGAVAPRTAAARRGPPAGRAADHDVLPRGGGGGA